MLKRRLAEMWCELNCHEVPKELKKFKFNHEEDAWGAMQLIEAVLGEKAVLKVWNDKNRISKGYPLGEKK